MSSIFEGRWGANLYYVEFILAYDKMAVINLDYHDLVYLLGKEIPLDEILARVPLMGSDIDSVEGDDINIEFFPNRPDLYSVEGIARALRGFFGLEPGLAKYDVEKSDIVLEVDPSVTEVRPFIVSALVKDVVIDDTLIKSLMEIQEKLHLTLGRKRKKLANHSVMISGKTK